jgi:hypothetical protein
MQQLVQSAFAKGKGGNIVFFGRDPRVTAAGTFALAESRRRGAITLGAGSEEANLQSFDKSEDRKDFFTRQVFKGEGEIAFQQQLQRGIQQDRIIKQQQVQQQQSIDTSKQTQQLQSKVIQSIPVTTPPPSVSDKVFLGGAKTFAKVIDPRPSQTKVPIIPIIEATEPVVKPILETKLIPQSFQPLVTPIEEQSFNIKGQEIRFNTPTISSVLQSPGRVVDITTDLIVEEKFGKNQIISPTINLAKLSSPETIQPFFPTKESLGKSAKVSLTTGAFFTPLGLPLLAGETAKGFEQVFDPNVQKELDRQFKFQLDQPIEEGFRQPTFAEFESFASPEIERKLKEQGATRVVLAGGLLGGAGAIKLLKIAETPVKITKPLRDIQPPFAREVQIGPIISGGKEFKIGDFIRITELTPPTITIHTTKGRQFFNLKPLDVKLKDATIFIDKPISPSIVGQPFVLVGKRTGGKSVTLSQVSGDSVFRSAETIGQLPKLEQFTFQRLAESKVGTTVSPTILPKLFKKDSTLVTADIIAVKLGRIFPEKGKIILPKEGTATTRALTVSEITLVKKLPSAELVNIKTIFKETTFPGARATGKTPQLETTLLDIKKTINLDELGGISGIGTKGTGTKTPLSKTFTEQVQKLEIKSIIPPPTKVGKTPATVIKTLETKSLPSIVSKSPTASQFAGTGLFERTDSAGLFPGELGSKSVLTSKFQPSIATISFREFSVVTPVVSQVSKLNLDTITKQQPKLQTQLKTKQITKTKTKQKQQQKLSLQLKQQLKTKQLTKSFLSPLHSTRTSPKKLREEKPFIILPHFPGGRKKKRGEFTVEVRRRGKFKPIATSTSLSKALSIGKERVGGTLAATFRVKDIGKLPSLPKGFRTKQTKSGVEFIEKRKFRLSRVGEKKEIQQSKRRKKKKK